MLNKNYFFCGLVGTIFFLFSSFLWANAEQSALRDAPERANRDNLGVSQKSFGGVTKNAGKNANKNIDADKNVDARSEDNSSGQKQRDFYQDPIAKSQESSNLTFVYLILRAILVLGAIAALAILFFYFFNKKQIMENSEQSLIRSIVDYRLSVSSRVQIIRVAQEYFMLVGGNEGAPYVQKIEDKQSVDEIKLFENQKATTVPRFFDDFFKMGALAQGQGRGDKSVGSTFLGLPRALAVTKMMREKMTKK